MNLVPRTIYERTCDARHGRCWPVTHWCLGMWELRYLPDDECAALDVCVEVPT